MPERFVSMRAYLKALYKYHLPFLFLSFGDDFSISLLLCLAVEKSL